MKTYKNLSYLIVGVIFGIALLVFIVYRSNQPKHVNLDISGNQLAEESIPVGENSSETAYSVAIEPSVLKNQNSAPTNASVVEPNSGESHAEGGNVMSAPGLGDVGLSPELQRSLAASESLSTETYTDPNSTWNSTVVEDLREMRKNRHKTKEF